MEAEVVIHDVDERLEALRLERFPPQVVEQVHGPRGLQEGEMVPEGHAKDPIEDRAIFGSASERGGNRVADDLAVKGIPRDGHPVGPENLRRPPGGPDA